ncbi:MAG: cobalamin B12-binding domain-containing protein [Planctomycetes bacterium]|nr:cobalamin B12-binding domain-containing protein [Planctomycetota bacterium]
MAEPDRIRVLVAKVGLDGHDRGPKVIAAGLRDSGMEVIYAGIHQTPRMIAEAAIQEDVDVVGLSIHSGAHGTLFPKVLDFLRAGGKGDVLVVAGGIFPAADVPALEAMGIARLFGPGTPLPDIVAFIRGAVAKKRAGTPSASTPS